MAARKKAPKRRAGSATVKPDASGLVHLEPGRYRATLKLSPFEQLALATGPSAIAGRLRAVGVELVELRGVKGGAVAVVELDAAVTTRLPHQIAALRRLPAPA